MIRFNKDKKPTKITYYNENKILKNAITYEYPKNKEVIISQLNNKGEVIERRIIKEEVIN